MARLSPEQVERYKRHLLLDEVGSEGQARLLDASVLIVGGGGLGSPAALYLAAAGIGRLGLVDFDLVDASNLQRQILYTTRDVGRPKVETARARLAELNPDTEVVAYAEKLEAANAERILRGYDVVLDGTDTFPSRYLMSDVCVWLGLPLVYGSVMKFEGQVSVFDARSGPCYRCLFPEPPAPEFAPNCAEAGVLGVLPGVIGLLQATEVLKLVLERGTTLAGRLLTYDALSMQMREFRVSKDPECPVCGPDPSIREPIDYEAFCASAAEAPRAEGIPEVEPSVLKTRLERSEELLLLDVREDWEEETARIEGARRIALGELERRASEDSAWKDRSIVIHCHHGARSRSACELLRSLGFEHVENLAGGIDRWSTEVDPGVPRY